MPSPKGQKGGAYLESTDEKMRHLFRIVNDIAPDRCEKKKVSTSGKKSQKENGNNHKGNDTRHQSEVSSKTSNLEGIPP